MTTLKGKLAPYLVYPSIIGTYHVRPLPWLLGNAPTVGQSLYIAFLIIINVILTCIDYDIQFPHTWYGSLTVVKLANVVWRTGVMGFAMLPLAILFAGRNNILLWLTHWSHSTYLLLHRWAARLFAVHVLLHSILALAMYIKSGKSSTLCH